MFSSLNIFDNQTPVNNNLDQTQSTRLPSYGSRGGPAPSSTMNPRHLYNPNSTGQHQLFIPQKSMYSNPLMSSDSNEDMCNQSLDFCPCMLTQCYNNNRMFSSKFGGRVPAGGRMSSVYEDQSYLMNPYSSSSFNNYFSSPYTQNFCLENNDLSNDGFFNGFEKDVGVNPEVNMNVNMNMNMNMNMGMMHMNSSLGSPSRSDDDDSFGDDRRVKKNRSDKKKKHRYHTRQIFNDDFVEDEDSSSSLEIKKKY